MENREKNNGKCIGCGNEVFGYRVALRKRGKTNCILCDECAKLTTHKPINFDEIKGEPQPHGMTAYIEAMLTKIDGLTVQAELLAAGFSFHGYGFRTAVQSSKCFGYTKVSKDLATLAYLVDSGLCKASDIKVHSFINGKEIIENIDVHFNSFVLLKKKYLRMYK